MIWNLKHTWRAGEDWKMHVKLAHKAWGKMGKYYLGVLEKRKLRNVSQKISERCKMKIVIKIPDFLPSCCQVIEISNHNNLT